MNGTGGFMKWQHRKLNFGVLRHEKKLLGYNYFYFCRNLEWSEPEKQVSNKKSI